jgi:hypothetical protein
MCLGLSTAAYANSIDSLITKESVLKFLSADSGSILIMTKLMTAIALQLMVIDVS